MGLGSRGAAVEGRRLRWQRACCPHPPMPQGALSCLQAPPEPITLPPGSLLPVNCCQKS
jgi:hypothetical protein